MISAFTGAFSTKTDPYYDVLPIAVADESGACAYGFLWVVRGGSDEVVEGAVVAPPADLACNANDAGTFFEDTVSSTGAPPA